MLNIDFPFKKTSITIDSKAQKTLDYKWTELTGLPLLALMEQAAMSVTAVCRQIIVELNRQRPNFNASILVLGGKGNNGGDAWACTRHLLACGYKVFCCEVLPSDDNGSDAARQLEALHKLEVSCLPVDNLWSADRPDLVVDGMLGSGYRAARGLPESVGKICRLIDDWRRQGTKVVSIDLPSGVDADNGGIDSCAVKADFTVTFAACKTGLAAAPGSNYAGRVIVEPLSMPVGWIMKTLAGRELPRLLNVDMIRDWKPLRPADGHKGIFGRALLIGGGKGMAGAARLAGLAAARSGVGLVHLVVETDSYMAVLPDFPEGLIKPFDFETEDCSRLIEMSADKQVLAIGPGLGSPGWIEQYLTWLLSENSRIVLDADALNEISRKPEYYAECMHKRKHKQLEWPVLTPHPGEFARLAPDLALLLKSDRQSAAIQLSARLNCIVVLKGAATVVAMPDGRCLINTSGNDGMAKGGSGDCLTGIIAGLAAQGMTMEKAACAGVYLHGLAGDLAADRLGKTAMLATDLLAELGNAWQLAGWLPGKRESLLEGMEAGV